MFTFGSGSYSIEFYILLPLFFCVSLPHFPVFFCVYASRCLPTFAELRSIRLSHAVSNIDFKAIYIYWLSLIKGSSNFYRFVCTSISFSFSFSITTTSTALLCLLFDARSIVQSQYKSSHVMPIDDFVNECDTFDEAQCTRARVRVLCAID